MSNNYFQFKEFTIQQGNCAMKVCTDACLFGAFIANSKLITGNILDIGTGTGLLSLMLAQKSRGNIDAVEIEAGAFAQAKENFEASPWKDRLKIYYTDILNFHPEKKYAHIISNPPFYEDNLRPEDEGKNVAKHDSNLTLKVLLGLINDLLSNEGSFSVLLTYHRIDYFEKQAKQYGFYLQEKLLVKHTADHPVFRGILIFSRSLKIVTNSSLLIKEGQGNYSGEFIELLKDYYLNI